MVAQRALALGGDDKMRRQRLLVVRSSPWELSPPRRFTGVTEGPGALSFPSPEPSVGHNFRNNCQRQPSAWALMAHEPSLAVISSRGDFPTALS
jgi:hypothetical protein